jgi:site-specific recombinase XerD
MNTDILIEYQQYVYGRSNKENTRDAYTFHIKDMLTKINKPYTEITQNDIDQYTRHCLEHYKRNGNAIRFWSIRKFIRWTGRTDLAIAQVNPIDAGKLALNDTETQKMLDTIETMRPLHRLIFYLEYDTIRRPDEIRRLKLNDRYQDILSYDGKTGRKKAFMTERLIKAWDEYIAHQRPLPKDETEAQYLLLSETGRFKGKHFRTHKTIDHTICEICMYSHVELPQGEMPTNYLIKRTTITQHLKECPDPKVVQIQAGHTKLQTTMKYNRIDDEHMRFYMTSWENKSTELNEKRLRRNIKDYYPPSETPVDSLIKKKDEDDGDNNGSYTFTYFSFEQHPIGNEGLKSSWVTYAYSHHFISPQNMLAPSLPASAYKEALL